MQNPPDTMSYSLHEIDLNDPLVVAEKVYQLWWHWANFDLYIVSPHIERVTPPIYLKPELIPNSDEFEHVYTIVDEGYKLSTSKAEEMYSAGMSMHKLYNTIEKMIYLLVERMKSGGISADEEVQVAFSGHLLAQRKAFESIINLNYNVVVTNFDPGAWGELYLQLIKKNAERFGYPPEAPRDTYKKPSKSVSTQRP